MYKRVLLKLSGEALMGRRSLGIDPEVVKSLAASVRDVHDTGAEIAIVVGGGNLFRGVAAAANGMERAQADYMGMLATVINGLALQDAFSSEGLDGRVMSALQMAEVCEPYIRNKALRHLEKGRICICVAGTGNPYFTTDSAASLRALELDCDCLIKATNVDGIYTADPKTDPSAKLLPTVTYTDVLVRDLHVMDATSIALCRDNHLPIRVLDIKQKGALVSAVKGENIGSVVEDKEQ